MYCVLILFALCLPAVIDGDPFATQPMLCNRNRGAHHFHVPDQPECTENDFDHPTKMTPERRILYRSNIVQYKTEACLCGMKIDGLKLYSTLFYIHWEATPFTHQTSVTIQACRMMCSKEHFCPPLNTHMTNKGTTWSTTIPIPGATDYPNFFADGHLSSTNTRTQKNGYTLKAFVYKRHGEEIMRSNAHQDVTHCNYKDGACLLANQEVLVWSPNKTEECAYTPYKEMLGYKSGRHWLSADKQRLITEKNQTFIDCDGITLHLTVQGIPFVRVPNSTTTEQQRRSKRRTNEPNTAGLVLSDDLGARLSAEMFLTTRQNTAFINHKMRQLCERQVMVNRQLQAGMINSPTLAWRAFLNQSNILAECAGSLCTIYPCSQLAPNSYRFVPMSNRSCTSYIPLKLTSADPASSDNVLYLNPADNIVHSNPVVVPCGRQRYVALSIDGQHLKYDRFSGKLSKVYTTDLTFLALNFNATNDLHFETVVFDDSSMYGLEEALAQPSTNDALALMNKQVAVLNDITAAAQGDALLTTKGHKFIEFVNSHMDSQFWWAEYLVPGAAFKWLGHIGGTMYIVMPIILFLWRAYRGRAIAIEGPDLV